MLKKQETKQKVSYGRTLWQEAWLRFKRNKAAMIGLSFIILLLVIAIATIIIDYADGGYIYKHYVIRQNLRQKLLAPCSAHIFGCDEFGRDIFFRMIWGTRYSLFVGISAIFIASIAGGAFGAFAGYYGGRLDNIMMRFMDVFLAIPGL